ncbi:MAG: acyl-CoA dehydrogenase family protein [Chloroflexota bacterium]|nr:acyl-CoA dehydrogenase family protein [Chloroflexota bacterium]
MDFRFTAEQEAFRKEVQEFLEQELPEHQRQEDGWIIRFCPEFSRKVARKKWIGLTWPKEYGGQGKSYLDRLILTEEMLKCGAPMFAHWFGDRQIGPSLLAHGTEEQKRMFLPKIIQAEISFCAGQSEPESGSDLASLSTQALEKDDHFLLNGQKVWTSGAHEADYCYMVVRTDPEAPKHRGISELIVDMKLPGITVRPLVDITGEHHLNEVFLDNVRVPKNSLVGQKNRGWYQIMSQLDYERSGIERVVSNYPIFRDTIQWVKDTGLGKDPWVRHELAKRQTEFEVGRLLCYRVAWLLTQGTLPNYEAAMAKFFCTEFEQRLADSLTKIVGLHGQLLPGCKTMPLAGRIAREYLYCPAYTLQGGTSEILRSIVATRGLNLQTN